MKLIKIEKYRIGQIFVVLSPDLRIFILKPMKPISILLLIIVVFSQSCGVNEREKKLKSRQEEIVKKEQQLLVWEQQLKMKEQALAHEKLHLDSFKYQKDAVAVDNPAIIGQWNVKMNCTETSCEGSALGDTKTEQWHISYDQNKVMVRAYSGPVLIRIYVGTFKNNTLKIVDEKPNADALIGATLNFTTDERMEGVREIKQKTCKIVYELNARKVK